MSEALTDRQRAMVLASEPSDQDPNEGAGVELWTGADYAVAKSLAARDMGAVEGPGQPKGLPGLYYNTTYGLALRRDLLGLPDPDEFNGCDFCGEEHPTGVLEDGLCPECVDVW